LIEKQQMRKTSHPQSLKQVIKPDRTGAGSVRLFSSKILPYKGWPRKFIPFLLIALILSITSTARAAWYDSNWQYRKAITIDGSRVAGGPHVDFPVLISITDTDLSAARADGWDLLFTDSDETAKLDHEIESFNNGSGVLVAWVRIPAPGITNGTDKTIYLYYGYPTVPADQQNVNGVWNASYQAVWHLKEDPSDTAPQMKDSTSSPNHGTSYGTMTTADQVPGKINGSLDFDGSDDEIRLSNAIIGDGAAFTITAWIQMGADTLDQRTIYSEGLTSATEYLFLYVDDSTPNVRFYSVNTAFEWTKIDGTTDVEDNQPHFVAMVQRSKTDRELFVDTVSQGTDTQNAGTLATNTAAIGFLRTDWVADPFIGILDEVRISNLDRSIDWITTEFNNQSNPGTGAGGFLSSVGPQEGGNVLLIVSNSAGPNASDQALKTYLENNGLTVFYADDDDADYNPAISANNIDVVYVSTSVGSSALGDKTRDLTVGVVMANGGSWDNQLLHCSGSSTQTPGTDVNLVDNSHFITQPFATGVFAGYNASGSLGWGDNLGAGAQVLIQMDGEPTQGALVVWDTNSELCDTSSAPARRVGIYTDDVFSLWTATTQTLVLRSLLWAGGVGGAAPATPAVTSAVAEISPNDVTTSSTGNSFSYDIQATIGGGDSGADRVAITVPGTFGVPTVTDVQVGEASVAYTDNTVGNAISVDLTVKVTSSDRITVLFDADAPGTQDLTGVDFTSTVDDSGSVDAAQATTEGNGDGDGLDNNSWTVTTADPVAANCPLAGQFFSNGFESGDLSAWNGSTTGTGDTIGASTVQANTGTYSARAEVDNVATGRAFVFKDFAGQTTVYAKNSIYLDPAFAIGINAEIMYLTDDLAQQILAAHIKNDMTLNLWNNVAGESYATATTISKGVWHTVEMMAVINGASSEARLWLDGNLEIVQTGIDLGANPITRFSTGYFWSNPADDPNIVYVDDVTLCTPSPGVTISGNVYHDINASNTFDAGELGIGLSWVKLISGGSVIQVVQADPDSGAYSLTNVPDGSYTVIVDDNNLPADSTPTAPVNWQYQNPATGSLAVNVSGSDVADQNFGFVFQFDLAADCVCGFDDGLLAQQTITINGDMSDWGAVLLDPDNNSCDATDDTDRDYPVQSTGRNLLRTAATYDGSYFAMWTQRIGSSNNTQNFIYYADTNNDGIMQAGEPVIVAKWQGNTGNVTLEKYAYDDLGSGGDPLLDANGFADGYSMPGNLTFVKTITGAEGGGQGSTAGNTDGTQMEWRTTWAELGIAPGGVVSWHIASTNANPGAAGLSAQIDDNVGGCGGQCTGSNQFGGVSPSPVDALPGSRTLETVTMPSTSTRPTRATLPLHRTPTIETSGQLASTSPG
jgi:hypothetical protein